MLQTDSTNTIFKLAADFVNNTSRHIFLTGKAGTGKTTFLRYIKENTRKHAAIIAPTGVAAINAGGVTMHSFFQLPFAPYIPIHSRGFDGHDDRVFNSNTLFKNIRFNAEKRELLQELELLIIDEVSMVRADMLDAMDLILRHFRKNLHQPFGGVQLLYIGDMYQLPPVVPDNEWGLLQPYYDSPFFFSAKVIADAPPVYIELKKIYRQNEQVFIDVLNRIRNNEVSKADLALLNSRHDAEFIAPNEEKYVTLTTHNKKADAINWSKLEKLPGRTTTFNGVITGDFSDKAFPTEMNLQLKEGAQVMFIKNDSGLERKFFNGKLAIIKKINADEIIVSGYDNDETLTVEKETWRNIRYYLNKQTNRIEEEELGSFTQYPLRLAWAITIHKSQGLTFEKAIIDAGGSFAAGQVYVALSRCTSLAGMVLLSALQPSAITTDERVMEFARRESAADRLHEVLQAEQQVYQAEELVRVFNWNKIVAAVDQFRELIPAKKLPDTQAAATLRASLFIKAKEQETVAGKFQQQLRQLIPQVLQSGDIGILEDRVSKAVEWFAKAIAEDLLNPLQQHMTALQHAPKFKKYVNELAEIIAALKNQLKKILQASFGDIGLCKNAQVIEKYIGEATSTVPVKSKSVKGSSQAETLALFKEGHSITAIASMRQLSETTIAGHLSLYVRSGELAVNALMDEQKLATILPVVKEHGGNTASPIKEILGDAFSFGEIRIVMNHWHWLQQQEVNA